MLFRSFMKDYRDPRYQTFFEQTLTPKINTTFFRSNLIEYPISGIEFDPTHKTIDFTMFPKELGIGLHVPFCYLTVGQICEVASIPREITEKFRPNSPCQYECSEINIQYYLEDDIEIFGVGRAKYFKNKECKVESLKAIRTIYFPFEELMIEKGAKA